MNTEVVIEDILKLLDRELAAANKDVQKALEDRIHGSEMANLVGVVAGLEKAIEVVKRWT